MPQAGDVRGARGVAEHRDYWIARHEMDQREGQGCDAERDRDECDYAADQVLEHASEPRAGLVRA